MLICFSVGNVWAADPVELASGTFDGKNGTYTTGWTVTATGAQRNDCVIVGKDESITSPSVDLTNYGSITISIKARRYGSLTGSKADIAVHFGETEIGTATASGTSATASLTDIEYTNTALTTGSFVFTCTNATSPGSTHGAGINSIVIKGVEKSGGDPVVLTSIEIGGDLTTKSYEEGDKLDYTGLTATGVYNDDSTSDLTDKVEWSSSPALTVGVTSVTVTATKGEISGNKIISGLTVAEHVVAAGTYDIPMTNALWGTSYTGTAADATEVSGTAHDVTITLTKGGSTNMYINDAESRAYKDYSLVIAAPAGYTLTKMVFTKGSNWNCSAEQGSLSGQTWTGEESSVSFSFGGRTDFKAVSVTYVSQAAVTVSAPVIAPTTEKFLNELEVSITCSTDGASIYYTLDGAEPTTASTLYTAPFTINATKTVKAKAFKGAESSSVVERTYTKVEPLSTMDEIFAAATSSAKDVYLAFNNWIVSGVAGNNAYVTDGAKGFVIYKSGHGFAANDKLNGTVAGSIKKYNGFAEELTITSATEGLMVTQDGSLTFAEATIADLGGVNTGAPVLVKNVTYVAAKSALVDANNDTIKPYTTFDSDILSNFTDGKTYNVKGIYVQFKETKEIAPRSAADIEEATVTPEPLTDGFYLISEADGWNVANLTAGKKFELNSGVEYKLTTTLAVGDKIKVVKVTSNAAAAWYPDGLDNEYTVDAAHAGANKDIYFQEEYKSDWAEFGGYFWTGENVAPVVTFPDTLYVWDGIGSTTAAIEKGGAAEAVQADGSNIVVGAAQKGNWCLKANKGFTSGKYYLGIALDEAVNAGDTVKIAYFRTSNSNTYVLGMDFSADKDNVATTYQILTTGDPEYLASNGAPEDKTFIVPEGVANAKYIRIYRNSGSTGLWVAKFVVCKLDPTAVPEPEIKADDLNFGTIRIAYNETSVAIDTNIVVLGSLLTDEIVATTTSTDITIANSPLPAAGGTLQLHIVAPVGAFNETIVLKSGEVTKNVAVSGTVKLKAAPPVLPENAFRLTFNGTGKEGTDASAVYDPNSDIFTDDCSAKVLSKDTVEKVYAGRPIEDDDSSLKFGTSDNPGTFVFTLAEAVEVDSIVVRAAQYDASASTITINKEEFTLDAGNKITKGCKITPTGAVDTISIKQIGSKRFYLRDIIVYVKQAPIVHTYTVAGSEAILGIAWDPSATINDMIEQPDGTYKLIKEDVTLHKATNYEYKVAIDHDWNHGEAGSNSTLTVEKDGRYNVTFTYDPVAPETSHSVELIQEINIDPVAVIAGELAHNGWLPGDTLTLSSDKKSASITLEGLAAGSYEFKMVINGEWQSADGEGDSKYTFHRGWKEAAHIKGGSRNMILEADVAGDYGVTWFFDNDSIAFTFPAPAPVYPDYFLKNNWGTAEWTWKQTTRDSEGLYRLENVVYGGTGVNFNTVAADNDDSKFVAHENLKYTNGSAIAPYDTVNFVLDPANDTIWAELVSKDVTRYSLSGSSLALFFNEWAPCHYYKYTDLNKLNDGSGNYDHKRSDVTLPAGEIEYKVVKNCSFDPAEDGGSWPVENAKLTIGESGIYDVTFTFNPATGAVNAEAVLKSAVTIQSLVVKGDWDDWAGTSLTMDSYSEKALGYVTLAAGDYEFKLQNEFSQWLGAGEAYSRDDNAHSGIVVSSGANMTLDADVAGEYLFTFVFETNQLIVTFPSKVPDVKIAALDGEFSINNSNGKAKFSRGNLQYNFGDNAWYAAEKQYEILSDLNLRFGDDTYSGSIDLFGWSCTNSNYGLLKSNKDADFTGDFVDWGDKFVGGTETWSTLSEAEWKYILGRKKGEQSLWTMASIGPDSITGLMLFPDKWNEPTGLDHTLTYGFFNLDDEATLKGNSISFSEWAILETAGAVFLPMTGARVGYVGNTTDGALNPINGSFCWVDNVVYYGYYWLSTPDSRTDYQHCAKYVLLPGWDEGPTTSDDDDLWTAPVVWSRERRRGDAVRLVYKYTVDPTAIDNAEFGEQVVKMLKDNQVVIIKGDKTFNTVGQRIR